MGYDDCGRSVACVRCIVRVIYQGNFGRDDCLYIGKGRRVINEYAFYNKGTDSAAPACGI